MAADDEREAGKGAASRYVRLAELLDWLCSNTYRWEAAADLRSALAAPAVGDLVVVDHVRRDVPDYLRVGTLTAMEPFTYADGKVSGVQSCNTTYVLRLLNGDERRWINVKVIRLDRLPESWPDIKAAARASRGAT